MTSETRKITISKRNIVDQIAAFLYATGAIPHDLDVKSIQFSSSILIPDQTEVVLTVNLGEEVEVFRL